MGCGTSNDKAEEQVNLPIRDLYKKQQLIGVGNHGSVYRGLHQLNHTYKAIKVINHLSCLGLSMFSRQKYAGTIEKFKSLEHPKIMKYQYAQLGGRQLSIVMEIAKEGTLHKYVKKHGKCTEEWTRQIIKQILEGLFYLHSNGIRHKDLKSNNVLMMGNDQIKISDYGLAEIYDMRLIDDMPRKGNSCQFSRGDSLPYMAPEVILNHGSDEKADVWSVGCIAIEMLTGKVPWSSVGHTFQEAFHKIRTSVYPPFPDQISKQCQNFLKSCLSVSEGRRNTVKELLMHPFINKGGQTDLYFEIANDSTLKPEVNKSNRVPSRNNVSSNEKVQVKTKGQKRYNNENQLNGNSINMSKTSRNLRKSQRNIANESSLSVSRANVDFSTIGKEDILPQINEDDEQTNIVMLNNKKVKMKSPNFKKQHYGYSTHMKTQPSQQQVFRNSIDLEQSNLNDSFEETRGLGKKIDTEPNLLIADLDSSKDYFKKPLKLLKKKIQQNKRRSKMNNISGTFTNESYNKIDSERYNEHRIRTNTQRSSEEVVINTEFARAERDRLLHEQLHMRKQRQEEKQKWEEELKKEAEHMRNQFARKYAYYIPRSMERKEGS